MPIKEPWWLIGSCTRDSLMGFVGDFPLTSSTHIRKPSGQPIPSYPPTSYSHILGLFEET